MLTARFTDIQAALDGGGDLREAVRWLLEDIAELTGDNRIRGAARMVGAANLGGSLPKKGTADAVAAVQEMITSGTPRAAAVFAVARRIAEPGKLDATMHRLRRQLRSRKKTDSASERPRQKLPTLPNDETRQTEITNPGTRKLGGVAADTAEAARPPQDRFRGLRQSR